MCRGHSFNGTWTDRGVAECVAAFTANYIFADDQSLRRLGLRHTRLGMPGGRRGGACRRPWHVNGLCSRRQRREQVRPICLPCLVHLSSISRPHLEQVRPAAIPRFFSVGRCGPPRGPPSLLGTQS